MPTKRESLEIVPLMRRIDTKEEPAMPFTVQKKTAETKWADVATFASLEEAIVEAARIEKHPSPVAAAARSSIIEVWARVLEGRRVIWK